jgi:hypothetical protein
MSFSLPAYKAPDFSRRLLRDCPAVVFGKVQKAGVAPKNYHATSLYPEYFHLRDGHWQLLRESRMDCVVILEKDGTLAVKEFRHLRKGYGLFTSTPWTCLNLRSTNSLTAAP